MSRTAPLAGLLFAAILTLGWNLGGFRLLDPDEGRNAEVAREMALSNDYVVPHLDGLPYLDKPIAYFASAALVMEVLGPSEFAARLPSYLAGVCTIVLLVWFARRRFGDSAGWLAGLAFATMPLTLGYSRVAMFDSMLTLCTTAAIVAWFENRPILAWVALAAGALCKGPIALAIPLATIIPFAVLRREPARRFVSLPAVLAFALVGLPWFFAVTRRFPEFPGYAFVTETFQRFTTPAFHRTQPFWFYVPVLFLGACPWIIPAGSTLGSWRAWWRDRGEPGSREAVLLACWVAGPFVLLTLNHSKLPQYVLPLCPAIALAAARVLAANAGAARRGYAATAIVLALVFLTFPFWGLTALGVTPDERAAIPFVAVALGVALAGSAAVVSFAGERGNLALTAAGYAAIVMSLPFTSGRLLRAVGEDRSAARLARAVQPMLDTPASDSIAVLGVAAYPPSLPFYLRRPVPLATASATELTSTYIAQFQSRYRAMANSPLRPAAFWREQAQTCRTPTVFIISRDDRDASAALSELPFLGADQRYVAYGPCVPRSPLRGEPAPPIRTARRPGRTG